MPPRNERVATMVVREIRKNREVGNDALRVKAIEIDRGVRRLSPRQFHTTYRLPALRAVNADAPAVAAPARRTDGRSTRRADAGALAVGVAPDIEAAAPAPARAAEPAVPRVARASEGDSAAPAATAAGPTAAPAPDAPAPARASTSKALARPHAAEREAVRAMLQLVAREALVTEDRAGFVRLLDSLDERAAVITGIFARA